MRKKIWPVCLGLLFLMSTKKVLGQENYKIESFRAKIDVQKNSSLLVEEIIETEFLNKFYGIVSDLPLVYNKEKINETEILAVTDGSGKTLPYKIIKENNNKKISIGDQNKVVEGKQTYRIKYLVENKNTEVDLSLNRDIQIRNMEAVIESPYAKILNIKCLENCQVSQQGEIFKVDETTLTNQNIKIKIQLENKINTALQRTAVAAISTGIIIAVPAWFVFFKKKES